VANAGHAPADGIPRLAAARAVRRATVTGLRPADVRELVEQLIVDKAQYQRHPDCGTLVCFVFDPGRRLPNRAAIERGLSGHDGILSTIVVVSPHGL
jgi:REase_DpnII-MboI